MILGAFVGLLVEPLGYPLMALIYAAAMLPFFYLPFLVLRERSGRQIAAAERLSFRQSLVTTVRNRAFLFYTATWALYWGTMTIVPAAIPFIVTEICLLSKADTVYFYAASVVVAVLCYPLVTWLAGRLGKWRVFTGSLLASAGVLASLALIGDWFPASLRVQGLLWAFLQAIALSGAMVLSPVLAAEVTDYDAQLTGQRREGSYYAAWGLLDNIVSGAATALVPLLLLLGRSHSDANGPLGVRMVGIVGGLMMLAAFFIFLRYPLRQGPREQPAAADSA
jgi:GPH family glycoside/pentoside/hexuronide:cation symporter